MNLGAVDRILPPRKAALARRLLLAGRIPDREDFAARGIGLNPEERTGFFGWLEQGSGAQVASVLRAADGTVKLALCLHDGEIVETVAMEVGAACLSTQIGCAVGCRFCASGLDGLRRNLATGEIVVQLIQARRLMRIDRVVFMGMGEPTHNLDAVLAAVGVFVRDGRIGPRRQTLSTVGSLRAFARLQQAAVQPCLAWSLHSPHESVRRELLPHAGSDPLPELARAADAYARASGTPVQVEYVLLAGINDGDSDIEALCSLMRGLRGYVNFIVLNPVAGTGFTSPPRARVVEIVRAVKRRGVLATIRDSAGVEAGAACGQLRRRTAAAPGTP